MADIVRALSDPAAYPEPTQRVELIQTHISHVFLTENFAYKLKKPVNLGFLDYTTPERREHFCRRELELNRRLAPGVYLEVVPVRRDGGRLRLGGRGEVVDWAVKMRRLPEARMMYRLLERGEVTKEMVGEVAEKLAAIHEGAATGPDINPHGSLQAIRGSVEQNLAQTEDFIEVALTSERHKTIKEFSLGFLERNGPLFAHRVETGRVREGHGDLHARNICFWEEVCIYDCIEFSDALRCGDVASEVAFLAMDLDFYGYPGLSEYFVRRYEECSGDRELLSLLDFYKCQRAFTRGKVHAFPFDESEVSPQEKRFNLAHARRYFRLAYRYAGGSSRPLLIAMCGLLGTGKSTLARGLAERLDAALLSSDHVRKRLAGVSPREQRYEPVEGGIYSRSFTSKTYATLLEEAGKILSLGRTVVLDATFARKEQRLLAEELARREGANFYLIECRCGEETVRGRLLRREAEGGSPSDGRWELFHPLKEEFEAVEELPAERHLVVDTDLPPGVALRAVLERLSGRASPSPLEEQLI
ncbi:MAG: AAA family ATPase [Nitrospinota bacterium]